MAPARSTARNQLTSITGCSPAVATRLLEEHHWNLDAAVNAYLESDATKVAADPQVEAIFKQYASKSDPETIDVDGVLRYLEDLEIEPEDPRSLTLAFFLEAPSMGVLPRGPFVNNWSQTRARSLKQMALYIDNFHTTIVRNDPLQFVQLYNFAFDFLMESPDQRLLAVDTAIDYWKMLLVDRPEFDGCSTRFHQWFEYLDTHKKAVTKDTWRMVYLFFREVVAKDPEGLKDYDEMASWPSVVDEYIEWLRESGHYTERA